MRGPPSGPISRLVMSVPYIHRHPEHGGIKEARHPKREAKTTKTGKNDTKEDGFCLSEFTSIRVGVFPSPPPNIFVFSFITCRG